MASEEACIEALRAAASELRESPTKAQYETLGYTPASGTIQRVFGSWNAAKEAAGLATNASRGSRVEEKPEGVALPDGEDWKDLTQDQRWHYRNPDRNRERTLDRRARHRAWVYERKRDSAGCDRCDETDPACLDFHHRPGVDKEMTISKMVTHGYSKDRLRDEIAKCDILCANCHRKEHFEVPNYVSAGSAETGDDE